jgi:hypothetical protein
VEGGRGGLSVINAPTDRAIHIRRNAVAYQQDMEAKDCDLRISKGHFT